MEKLASIWSASRTSRILRDIFRSGLRKICLASCCVMVEAPCTTRRAMKLRTAERMIPLGDIPQCLKKLSSSTAMTAFWRSTGILVRGRSARFSMESSAITPPFESKTLVLSDGEYSSRAWIGGKPSRSFREDQDPAPTMSAERSTRK
ncbi:MAG: hypothetical protein A2506_12385 [Elusimicrobia bacterium RIFOXYD12_FULL_66_9]|nr:MAG: hypothetical protein A2506_12385 [Elusimicrobia bacterium RIFOXYD12_FULL_66_9]